MVIMLLIESRLALDAAIAEIPEPGKVTLEVEQNS